MEPLWFPLAIVGSGPAGLSASVNATHLDIPHLLIERGTGIAQTIRAYSVGKTIMAEPVALPSQGVLRFAGGSRESVLAEWHQLALQSRATLRMDRQLESIERQGTVFRLRMHDDTLVFCDRLILALGLAGRPRRLEIPGGDSTLVDYGNSIPSTWQQRVVVVVGGGDSAIEAALSLAARNTLTLVNRSGHFRRARARNLALLQQAREAGRIKVLLGMQPVRVSGQTLYLQGPHGSCELPFDHLCVRIGALPNRSLLEAVGVAFRSEDEDALPCLSPSHESSVPRLYIIGALAGCRLIKPCINQGWEVIQAIVGAPFETAPQRLIKQRFGHLLPNATPGELLDGIRRRAPLYADLDDRSLEALLLDSGVLLPELGEQVLRKSDHTDAFYVVLAGSVLVEANNAAWRRLGPGACFGERSLLTGQRRNANVIAGRNCVLIENPRLPMLRAMREHRELGLRMNSHFLARTLKPLFGTAIPHSAYIRLSRLAISEDYQRGEAVLHQGEPGTDLYLLVHGALVVQQTLTGNPALTLAEIHPGDCFGEHGLLTREPRAASVIASLKSEVLRIPGPAMHNWLADWSGARLALARLAELRYRDLADARGLGPSAAERLKFLHAEGMAQASNALVIDNRLCVGCDQCEHACAATHDGRAQFRRPIGPTGADLHIPEACRHCVHPACMDDCPPGAIQRDSEGRVRIDASCIACGHCVQNCPYGAIQLLPRQAVATPSSGMQFWSNLLFGQAQRAAPEPTPGASEGARIASKCDACVGRAVPACVAACPTGAASRVSGSELRALATTRALV